VKSSQIGVQQYTEQFGATRRHVILKLTAEQFDGVDFEQNVAFTLYHRIIPQQNGPVKETEQADGDFTTKLGYLSAHLQEAGLPATDFSGKSHAHEK
jgi:hypothetical protein